MSKITYSNYKNTRDLAWSILIENNICELPVKISSICRNMNIKIKSYEDAKLLSKLPNMKNAFNQNDGFSMFETIFYNQDCNVGRQRFTVAHELLHIIKHERSYINREPSADDSPIETEANIFASRILAPACVLWALNITNAEDISKLCNISLTAARFRMERLNLLYEREKRFLNAYGRSCFLQSPLERKVYEQFKPYITSIRACLRP